MLSAGRGCVNAMRPREERTIAMPHLRGTRTPADVILRCLESYRPGQTGPAAGDAASLGCVLNTARESTNITMQPESSHRNVSRARVNGTKGLKSTAIEANPHAQKYK